MQLWALPVDFNGHADGSPFSVQADENDLVKDLVKTSSWRENTNVRNVEVWKVANPPAIIDQEGDGSKSLHEDTLESYLDFFRSDHPTPNGQLLKVDETKRVSEVFHSGGLALHILFRKLHLGPLCSLCPHPNILIS